MTLRIDPEQNEVHALRDVTDWHGKSVLELGCGGGRLTQRLAQLGARVQASDSDAHLIAKARKDLPKRFAGKVHFKVGNAEKVHHLSGSFDAVVYAWSL